MSNVDGVAAEAGQGDLYAAGSINTFYLPVADAAVPTSTAVATVHDLLQGAVYMSRDMALARLYPAIDPLVSWSHVLREDVVGADHVAVARQVRDVLCRVPLSGEPVERTAGDQTLRATAERLRAYLTQPFYVAEPYTKLAGEFVPVAQTVRDCREILSGKYKDIPAADLYFKGGLDCRGKL
ncbi:MAG TPA: hypothetical protein VFB58_03170 [Chloroflexota bacterium]|nr:hypothetical protein [Chloroflexota bacterium]